MDDRYQRTLLNGKTTFETSDAKSLQYNAALAIIGARRGTSTDKIYEELGWETLSNRRWYRRLSLFLLIANNQAPLYLCDVINPSLPLWRRNQHDKPNGNRFKTF